MEEPVFVKCEPAWSSDTEEPSNIPSADIKEEVFIEHHQLVPIVKQESKIQLVEELLEIHGKTADFHKPGRSSKTPPPQRLIERHFIERLPPTEKKAKPYKRCVVCMKKTGKRKETPFWCKECGVGLCVDGCFKVYHTEANF